jgi:F-type H+-transporting ATPase subunit b
VELNWSTFALEILNFLVLLWILKRFLYRPVLEMIERRQADIRSRIADADHRQHEADALKTEYGDRLRDWQQEREAARAELRHTLAAERTRQLTELRDELAKEREKARVLIERSQQESTYQLETAAMRLAASFATRLLADCANPALEQRLAERVLADLRALDTSRIDTLRAALPDGGPLQVMVESVWVLPDAVQAALTAALGALAGSQCTCTWTQNPALLAGLRITAGPWVLGANLRDELQAFVDLRDDGSAGA